MLIQCVAHCNTRRFERDHAVAPARSAAGAFAPMENKKSRRISGGSNWDR
jgi:hypothetical protein